MNLAHTGDNEFISRLTEIVETNLGDENFGVRELAKTAGLNQSYLSRRLHKISGRSVSRFIMEVRLRRAMDILREGELTAAEIAYKVGFGSATYFNNCFRDFYGYPPGEVKRRVADLHESDIAEPVSPESVKSPEGNDRQPRKEIKFRTILKAVLFIVFAGTISYLVFNTYFSSLNNISGYLKKNREKTIAVLPFVNLSDDKDNQYFADGVMEDILTNLSRIRELKVISRTSTEQFRNSSKTTPEIARILVVNYILEGSVQRYGDKVRVRVQFIDARNDRHLLSKTYDRGFEDIFLIQSDIAKQVAGELQAALSGKEIEQIEKVPTKNPEAYNFYLKGRFFWKLRTREDINNSITYYEKAIVADPDYALAYAGLADTYFILAWWGWIPRAEGYEKAKKLALQALQLDKNLSEAHTVLAELLFYGEWKWEDARKEFMLAIELNPNNESTRQFYSELLDILGENEEARVQINRALELDPFFPILHIMSAIYYRHEGKYKESMEACKRAEKINPGYGLANWNFLWTYLLKGEDSKAYEVILNLYQSNPLTIKHVFTIKGIFNQSGINGVLKWMLEQSLTNHQPNPLSIARFYALLGNNKEALDWLEKALAVHSSRTPEILNSGDEIARINIDPVYKNLRTEPRFQALINQMGLSDYHVE
jgi:TolB-like protein/AraC-like DNA-binding protein